MGRSPSANQKSDRSLGQVGRSHFGDVGSAIAFHKQEKRSLFGKMAFVKNKRSLCGTSRAI
ncbi:hypothetical protein A0J48_000260 [Sphaerospermopsis aphanizomenoides BCCUSP55]|uniref:hypothetical protein n=1 Tax=Sphaerospermopsis aphanizomenoides TaxID=459663 RepID=UPI00190843CD|nr:hypothetical protein [Sphaerospermopsis aphanizomenoides]MBK1985996.1 hypothetical protein [Sphaerospermopsis aphanizomenoides BCCUSP55]